MSNESRTPNEREPEDSLGDRIDLVCDEYEERYQSGTPGQLRAFLDSLSWPDKGALFVELMLVDRELRRRDGETLDWAHYLASFPEYAEDIEATRFRHPAENGPAATPLLAQPSAPRKLAHFELIEIIGSGGAADVWKARDTQLQRAVAIKVPRGHISAHDLTRFLREGRSAAQLKHPGIVQVFEVGRDGDTAYIACALIAGESLRDWLRRNRPAPRQAAELIQKVAEAIDSAHEQGVIHRDLKPGNILLDAAGLPHVTDFGLAKWSEQDSDLTLQGEVLGTPQYMSPEQARGHAAQADRRTDVYALGVILYELLTGRCPFVGDKPAVILQQILHDDPARPRSLNPAIPRDLETICLKAMEKSPDRRYASAQELAVDLRRLLRGDPILARPTGPAEKTWRWIKRRPALTAALVLMCGLCGLAIYAGRLAVDNIALQGYRTVTLETEPPGAKVAFVKLDETTGEPDKTQITRPSGRTPLQAYLKPGDYLVVAALDEKRFHEVYRRVPKFGDSRVFPATQYRWDELPDNTIALRKIAIPPTSVVNGMAEIRSSGLADAAQTRKGEPGGFYVDCNEFSKADDPLTAPAESDDASQVRASSSPAKVDYLRACFLAESVGKRLPSDAEFECTAEAVLATSAVLERTTTSDVSTESRSALGPSDITNFFDGSAEWTTSQSAITSPHKPVDSQARVQIVRGGAPQSATTTADARFYREYVDQNVFSRIGFRCVRSLRPRFLDLTD